MKKIIGAIWFNCFGIILVNNDGKKEAYIGEGKGLNEDADIQHIIDWGTKVEVGFFKSIVKMLEN